MQICLNLEYQWNFSKKSLETTHFSSFSGWSRSNKLQPQPNADGKVIPLDAPKVSLNRFLSLSTFPFTTRSSRAGAFTREDGALCLAVSQALNPVYSRA